LTVANKPVLIGLKYRLKGLKGVILRHPEDVKNFYKNRLYRKKLLLLLIRLFATGVSNLQ
jgi:hypothetical protein